ncbi:uncharacterized protein EV422DRAFT_562887 [Fimicolochytrium jonesii]|uniref:uncharacterized protein n=1 Tax=Fimicolochytrium jonesii TaxID=1396493 RepID=UPI0022FF0369|nr:uncharacterized protein EV422DRAFT_562887 [Fimicolochytrium jonesii]KAI8826830.1 hypothetical protein EV422DRAFT_562887 [Fimicolochytrium jonesii]
MRAHHTRHFRNLAIAAAAASPPRTARLPIIYWPPCSRSLSPFRSFHSGRLAATLERERGNDDRKESSLGNAADRDLSTSGARETEHSRSATSASKSKNPTILQSAHSKEAGENGQEPPPAGAPQQSEQLSISPPTPSAHLPHWARPQTRKYRTLRDPKLFRTLDAALTNPTPPPARKIWSLYLSIRRANDVSHCTNHHFRTLLRVLKTPHSLNLTPRDHLHAINTLWEDYFAASGQDAPDVDVYSAFLDAYTRAGSVEGVEKLMLARNLHGVKLSLFSIRESMVECLARSGRFDEARVSIYGGTGTGAKRMVWTRPQTTQLCNAFIKGCALGHHQDEMEGMVAHMQQQRRDAESAAAQPNADLDTTTHRHLIAYYAVTKQIPHMERWFDRLRTSHPIPPTARTYISLLGGYALAEHPAKVSATLDEMDRAGIRPTDRSALYVTGLAARVRDPVLAWRGLRCPVDAEWADEEGARRGGWKIGFVNSRTARNVAVAMGDLRRLAWRSGEDGPNGEPTHDTTTTPLETPVPETANDAVSTTAVPPIPHPPPTPSQILSTLHQILTIAHLPTTPPHIATALRTLLKGYAAIPCADSAEAVLGCFEVAGLEVDEASRRLVKARGWKTGGQGGKRGGGE